MKTTASIVAIVTVVMFVFSFGRAISQEDQMPGQEEIMAMMAKYGQPSEHHKNLEPLVGSWDLSTKWWMEPNSEPQESKASSESRWILGGRFLQANVTGDMSGTPFHGIGILGFDNFNQEYISLWIDEMSTSFMLTTGTADEAGKVITMEGTYDDFVTGQKNKKFRTVTRIIDNDTHIFEMYDLGDDGKEFKSFEVVYSRRK